MARRLNIALCTLVLAGTSGIVSAQPPGGPGGFGGRGGGAQGFGRGGDMMRMLPLMAALDADEDGEISSEEISKSIAALKGLDKNKDGKLTAEELRPQFGGPGGPGGEREGRGGPGGERPGAEGGRGPGGDMVSRLMAFDKNQDGKLAKDEVDGRMQAIFARADADNDGYATKEEIEKLASAAAEERGGRGGPGEGGPGEGGPGGRGGFGGPGGNPEEFLNRAFEFDADKDGKLSKEELTKMLESAPQRGGREGGARGERPQRPQSDR